MDLAGIDTDLDRLRAAVARVSANLLELEAEPTRAMLDAAELEGATAERWESATDALRRLFVSCSALKSVLDAAAELRRSRPLITVARVERLQRLLRGRSIEVDVISVPVAERGLLADSHVVARATPDEVLERMAVDFETAKSVIVGVSLRWNALPSRVQRARARLTELDELATRVGESQVDLDHLRSRIDAIARVILTDPLSIDPGQVGQLDVEIDHVERALRRLETIREDVTQSLAHARTLVAEAQTAVEECADAHRRASARFVARSVPEPPTLDPSLERLFSEAGRSAVSGDWRAVAAALDDVQSIADGARRDASEIADRYSALVRERDELRGRLDAYQAKAGALGLGEHSGLSDLHDRAHTELFTAPTDLARARDLVIEYQRAIRTIPDRSEGQR